MTLTAGTLSGSSALNANGGMLINPAGGQFQSGRPHGQQRRPARPRRGPEATIDNIEASDGSVFNNLGTFVVEQH